eukprot:356497-Chlamydomonas_euryale.AAC.4
MTRGVRSGSEVWPPRCDGRRRARPVPPARHRDVDIQCIPSACANFGGGRRGSKNKGLSPRYILAKLISFVDPWHIRPTQCGVVANVYGCANAQVCECTEELSHPSRCRATPSGVNLMVYFPPTVPSCTSSGTAACTFSVSASGRRLNTSRHIAAGHGQPHAANQASLTRACWDTLCLSVLYRHLASNNKASHSASKRCRHPPTPSSIGRSFGFWGFTTQLLVTATSGMVRFWQEGYHCEAHNTTLIFGNHESELYKKIHPRMALCMAEHICMHATMFHKEIYSRVVREYSSWPSSSRSAKMFEVAQIR